MSERVLVLDGCLDVWMCEGMRVCGERDVVVCFVYVVCLDCMKHE